MDEVGGRVAGEVEARFGGHFLDTTFGQNRVLGLAKIRFAILLRSNSGVGCGRILGLDSGLHFDADSEAFSRCAVDRFLNESGGGFYNVFPAGREWVWCLS